ncbi:hypothetical protein [Burkholderia diffusa]|uniref:hypothetical protein n=1 Tax=Burkholderia diffusa TaxID=488732 RepID=UPI0012447F35|nr:hypothetical protein [Burkholderia diffusa]KAB0655293.1 hypothetical protein F7R23_17160 [Burkholderia diffusa]MBM2653803.1 hypothetical protein [Burkholderia diffusa]
MRVIDPAAMIAGEKAVVGRRECCKPACVEHRTPPCRQHGAIDLLGVCADGDWPSCMPVVTFARDRLPDAASLS